jgi:hypothetical protein
MDFSFNAKTFRTIFESTVEEYFQDASASDDESSPQQLVAAMMQAIDVMERADADADASGQLSGGTIENRDISQIGDYALTLVEGLIDHLKGGAGQEESAQQNRELMRLTVPVALWIAKHGGTIEQLELVVNSLAGYANDLREPQQLADLCRVYRDIIPAVSEEVRQDLEQTNPMRPWRILNLNYGIVATRSHDPELIEEAYASLIKNLPQDARQFFKEGMQQMDVVGYPQEVREVVEKYDRMWGADSTLH